MKQRGVLYLTLFGVGMTLFSCWQLYREWRDFSPDVVLAVRWKQVQTLCYRWGYPVEDFLKRAQVWGLRVVLGEDITLQDFVEQGIVLYFSRAESQKWKALGMIDPQAPLRPRQLWLKTPWLVSRVLEASQAHGIFLSTTSAYGYTLVEIPPALDLRVLRMGFDEATLSLIHSMGLRALDSVEDASMDGNLFMQDIFVSSPRPIQEILFQKPGRWLNIQLDIDHNIEENLQGISGISRQLRALGFTSTLHRVPGTPRLRVGLPFGTASRVPGGHQRAGTLKDAASLELWLRHFLALGISCLVPLLGLKFGFKSLKWALRNNRWPLASPVWEVGMAYGVWVLIAIFLGFWVHGLQVPGYTLFTFVPVLLGFLALFPIQARSLKLGLQRVLSVRDLFVMGGCLALWLGFRRYPFLWDLFERWKEEVLFLPALFMGLWFYYRRLQDPDLWPNPRWLLLLGLIGVASLLSTCTYPWVPFWVSLWSLGQQILWGAGLGLLGAMSIEFGRSVLGQSVAR
ncbi:MAG: hypothetical protein HY400_03325 [Elusimicrobia bacterium]|nr:hypothetical protein [Elusimicrobiota bacterium]